jgi:hypothetical protein
MNLFLKNYYVLLLMFFAYNGSFAMTLNGQALKDILKPGQILSFTPTANVYNIAFSIKNGHVQLGTIEIGNDDIAKIKAHYIYLKTNKHKLSQSKAGDTINIQAGQEINASHAYYSAGKLIKLCAGQAMKINDSILKSKEAVLLAGNNLDLKACFLTTKILQISSSVESSFIKAIRFTYVEKNDLPCLVQGQLSFEKNETNGQFTVLGVKEIEIEFAPEAFKQVK